MEIVPQKDDDIEAIKDTTNGEPVSLETAQREGWISKFMKILIKRRAHLMKSIHVMALWSSQEVVYVSEDRWG